MTSLAAVGPSPGEGPAVAARPNTQSAPRSTVIVVNYNGGQDLSRCLESLQEVQGDFEILVVDNGSTDGSAEFVAGSFPGVRVLRNETNLGFGAAANLGGRLARGEFLAFLNPDCVVGPGWLEALLAALDAHPEAGLATSKILLLTDPGRINTCGNTIHCTGLTLCRGMEQESTAFDQVEEVDAVSGAAFCIQRELFERLGGFDPGFFLYLEDTDLSWRARLAGYCCLYVPGSLAYHGYRLRFGPQKTYYEERNRYQMLLKGLRWPTLFLLLPALLLGEVVTWGFVLLRERRGPGNKGRAYAWILGHWRQVMVERGRAQALRQVQDRTLLARSTHRLDWEQVTGRGTARLAHVVLDPLFFVAHRLALALMWW